jgi:lysozyme
MDLDKLRKQLEIDEGVKHEIYLDHLGLPTFGIGHLVTKNDAESGQDVGTAVSEERVRKCFEQDVLSVINDCTILYHDFDNLPEEAQQIIANMMFNLGRTRLSKFKGMKRGIDDRDWNRAADEMVDSRWYRQVTNRAQRLVERMRVIGNHVGDRDF